MTFKVQKSHRIIQNDIFSDLDSQLLLSQSLHWAQCIVSDQIVSYGKATSPRSEHTEGRWTPNLPPTWQKLILFIVNLLISSDLCVFTAWNYWFLLQFILLHQKIFIFLLSQHLFTVTVLPLSVHFDKLSRASSVGVLVRQILQPRSIFCASYSIPMKLLARLLKEMWLMWTQCLSNSFPFCFLISYWIFDQFKSKPSEGSQSQIHYSLPI